MQELGRDHTPASNMRSDGYRRAFDLTVSVLLVVLTLPIVAVAAAGSALSLRAWPFFCQQRVGRNGDLFTLVKIRTLHPTVPAHIDKHELAAHDIPGFCRLLRALHLDELPQLYLVIAGRMSLVGPRPEMVGLHSQMHPAFAAERTVVRPGCTGLWQVSVACVNLIHATPHYDRFYLAHRTLRLDIWVLVMTALQMARLAGLITLQQVPAWALRHAPSEVIDLRPVIDLRDNGSSEPSAQLTAANG